MKKDMKIEYRDPLKQSFSDINQLHASFAKIAEVEVTHNHGKNIDQVKQSPTQKQEVLYGRPLPLDIKPLYSFPLSVQLLNLLRRPHYEGETFSEAYMHNLKTNLPRVDVQNTGKSEQIIIYLHLILSRVVNLQNLPEFVRHSIEILPLKNEVEFNNSLNAYCLMTNLNKLEYSFEQKIQEIKENQIMIHIIKEANIFEVKDSTMSISLNYVEKALHSKGKLDLHFESFLIHRWARQGFLPKLQHFDRCKEYQLYQMEYAFRYESLIEQRQIDYEEWYLQQVDSLVNNVFSIEEVRSMVASGEKSQWIEKFLIGLQGWDCEMAEEAVPLLNAYYDGTDWQIATPLRAIIAQVGENFSINYLIQNKLPYRHNLLLCLKAPCMDKHYNEEVFSWHHIRLKQYKTQQEKYLWIFQDFGPFRKCGFYDWKLYEISEDGINKEVNKIVNMGEMNSFHHGQKNIYNVNSVQSRVIVHPLGTRELQMHEIYMDSLTSNQNLPNKVSHFSDAVIDIERYAKYGINCAYLMGVLERDNGKLKVGYKRPQASPMAVTCRKTPCEMFGGSDSFQDLVHKSQESGVKIVVDCTTRVSASRMNKRYEQFLLGFLDETGKKLPLYGTEGRSIHYDETTVLNYRMLEAWNLLESQVSQFAEKYGTNGIYLDQGYSWPQIYELDKEELQRMQNGEKVYSPQEIFEGKIVKKNKQAGYWTTKASQKYPNPFLVRLCKNLWSKYPDFLFICEGFQLRDEDIKTMTVLQSGPIPRLFTMPKALAQIVGVNLSQNGQITQIKPKTMNSLKRWYEEVKSTFPKNAILIQSTTSHTWPYPAYIFRRATWAMIDLFFFLPEIPMTFVGEHDGKAFRTKSTSMFFCNGEERREEVTLRKTYSSFFDEQSMNHSSSKVISSVNATIRDPAQIEYLEKAFRKEVGPEFGYDLSEIHKHYNHRRKLRSELKLLTSGRMMSVSAEHMYGVHKNIISFLKWNNKQILLIAVNFNSSETDMHFNLTNLKYLFVKANRSNVVIELKEILGQTGLKPSYYTVGELLTSKIEVHLKGYKSMIWSLTIQDQSKLEEAFKCSRKRLIERIVAQPPKWIYSSVLTNQISHLVKNSKSIKFFVKGLNALYDKFIGPDDLDMRLIISKTYDFWMNRDKLSKLFGIFKVIEKHPSLKEVLKKSIKNLIDGNTLGPIAFVTPEIGGWSSVGGLGVMVDELSKELVKLGQVVYIITPYYEYNKKKQTNYLIRDGFVYDQTIKIWSSNISYEFGIHRGNKNGVNFIWLHNPELFSRPYAGQSAIYITKQLVFFALSALESCCQLKMFPSTIVTNDWMCGFVSGYVKVGKYQKVFEGTKFMHICHNLAPDYEGKLYPKPEEGNLNWLIQLPTQWYVQYVNNKLTINPSKCALETCDNWGTVSNSYKYDLLKESGLAPVLWKHPHPFSFPNGVRKEERLSIIKAKTPGSHMDSKRILQQKYFNFDDLNNNIPLFSFIGRVTKQKGVHLILDSVESLLYEYNFKIQFLVGGLSDSKEEYGKYCAERMKYLKNRYPNSFWSNPDAFFLDGALANIGSDFAMMPSLFEPGGIVQHEFFCGSTPVIAFKTGGLKDTVFEYNYETNKGNGFNFMSYDVEDFKRCMRRAIQCYKVKPAYEKLRCNAFESVVEEEDVAKAWNTEFYRLQNKMYIDSNSVQKQVILMEERSELKVMRAREMQMEVKEEEAKKEEVKKEKVKEEEEEEPYQLGEKGEFWSENWDLKKDFKRVLVNAQRIQGKTFTFIYETDKIPRPREAAIVGSWDDWKDIKKMKYDSHKKLWTISLMLKPGTYQYKYFVEHEWVLTKQGDVETDIHNNENHVIVVD